MIIASNFKTNHTRATTKRYVEQLNNFIQSNNITDDIYIFPPNSAFDNFNLTRNLSIGTQNAYPTKSGSFTGEIGLEQLDEFNINTILIGHSERRHIIGEKQDIIEKKFQFFSEKNFNIIYCIGEPKEIREEGIDAVMEYLWSQFDGIDVNYDKIIVAYEPVWAIGTGLSATTKEIDETLNHLKKRIKAPLLYGGSVKVENTKEILQIKNCEGILVGTASWQIDNFCEMISISKKIDEEKTYDNER